MEDREDRILVSGVTEDDGDFEVSLRPKYLIEFIGQPVTKEHLEIFIEAAKSRGEALDHVLLAGPPGLGKTTLAGIIANELGVNFKITSGPALERAGDLAAIITNLQEGDVLFIDEIHRLNRNVEESLYPAMEDFVLDLIIGKGPSARTLRLDIPRFTMIGATTRSGLITSPLRERFGVSCRLDFYSFEELSTIVTRSARILGVKIDTGGAIEIAKRSRGTPRIANRLLRRVRDFAQVRAAGEIDEKVAKGALSLLKVDEMGLDATGLKILQMLINKFDGGPVGLSTLATALGEEADTLEIEYEPYLLQIGFLQRTPRGRVATRRAYEHLGQEMGSGSKLF